MVDSVEEHVQARSGKYTISSECSSFSSYFGNRCWHQPATSIHGPCNSHIQVFFWVVKYIEIFIIKKRILGFQVLRNTRSLVLESATMIPLKSNEHMTGILQMCFIRDANEQSYTLPMGIQITYPFINIPKTPLSISIFPMWTSHKSDFWGALFRYSWILFYSYTVYPLVN